ncbi:MAG: hypothetical protein ACP5UZ_08370 [Thermoplasmata archaeon]
MTRYFVFKVTYQEGEKISQGSGIELKTKKNRDLVSPGDKFLLYLKEKGIMATGFSIRTVSDTKPYLSEISVLPSFISKYKPDDSTLLAKSRLVEISPSQYQMFKEKMESMKVGYFSELKSRPQQEGTNFENEVFNFFKELFAPLSEFSQVNQKVTYLGKYPTEVSIKFRSYEILCDAFINPGEITRKIQRFKAMYHDVDSTLQSLYRFVLFYRGDEDDLSYDKESLPKNIIILGARAKEYYEWLLEKTHLVGDKGKKTPVAAYHLLGELGISIPDEQIIAKPYIKLNDGENLLYIFKKDVKEMVPILYVARRERGSKKFYQRLLRRDKMEGSGSIDDYLSPEYNNTLTREHTTFLNSVVISPEEVIEQENHIAIPFKYGSVAILDGQHRVYGSYLNSIKIGKQNELYFTAIVDKDRRSIPMEVQQEYFVSINTEQTKVEPEQIWRSYGELKYYRNRSEGIISQIAKELEKKEILHIKKQMRKEPKLHGISFAGLCENVKKYLSSTNLIYKSRDEEYSDGEAREIINKGVKQLQIFLETFKEGLTKEQSQIFLGHDGRLSILFKIFYNIYKQNDNRVDERIVKPYVIAFKAALEKDPTIKDNLETSGEGPRSKSAEMLALLINGELPGGTKVLGYSTGIKNNPVLKSIGLNLSKLAATSIKDENGKKLPVFDSTGGWFSFALELSKEVTSEESFYNNVVNTLYKLLHEHNRIPEEFRNKDVKQDIDYLRTWIYHDTHDSDIRNSEIKKDRAISVVKKYLGTNKLPNELTVNQLIELKDRLLKGVDTYLLKLQEYIDKESPVYRPP